MGRESLHVTDAFDAKAGEATSCRQTGRGIHAPASATARDLFHSEARRQQNHLSGVLSLTAAGKAVTRVSQHMDRPCWLEVLHGVCSRNNDKMIVRRPRAVASIAGFRLKGRRRIVEKRGGKKTRGA